MDAEEVYELKKGDAVQMIQTIQTMIDVSADRLKGLRTQCLTSAELTQQEIRTLEGKLVKHFSQQMAIKAKFGNELSKELGDIPCLELWLRVVGLSPESIEAICSRVATLEGLKERTDHELKALLPNARDEEVKRLTRAMQRLRSYMEALAGGAATADMPLYWDSWERRPRTTDPRRIIKQSTSPIRRMHLPTPASPMTKSRSHESQLTVRPDASDLSDNSQSSITGEIIDPSPPSSPPQKPQVPTPDPSRISTPRSPRTPVGRVGMAHDIAHRFCKTFAMLATCDYCDKQMLFGSGLKCKECKYKCHRDCESKVPSSCGLPPQFVEAFRHKIDGGGYYGASAASPPTSRGAAFLAALGPRRSERGRATAAVTHTGPDSSSTTSSCNSSAPSSPAPPPTHKQLFHFPEIETPISSPNHVAEQSPARIPNDAKQKDDLTSSVKSERSLSGSNSTDSGDARTEDVDNRWPRQNSLSMKEWDIPYDELLLFDQIGSGRFGTVYRGRWHGAVAVKLLRVPGLDDPELLEAFRHEVATFRKTRHENLVLFMGACMKPPKLAVVTSLCKGLTLYRHIHQRKDKFNTNRSVTIAQQLAQGMGYLHARGIIHKDLKTRNIFLENGKVVISDFGLFSVTKLCYGNNASASLAIPEGWLANLAPELVRALRPRAPAELSFTKQSDVYAFGSVWYEILSGEWPFKDQPSEAVIWQVGKGVKQTLAELQASRDIKELLNMCWSYNPEERPDFALLLATLEKLPRKRLARSPSHPVQLSRSADSVL